MNTIRIGSDERLLSEADPQWIAQEIEGRRQDGQAVCVIVAIKTADLDIRLTTPACSASGGGGGRAPTTRESAVLELWRKHHLDSAKFSPGDAIAFVKQVSHFL